MPPSVSNPTSDQDTHPPPLVQEPFVFHRPQYHNGLLTTAERLNERRIRMAMLAHGDGPDCLVRLSPERLRQELQLTHAVADSAVGHCSDEEAVFIAHEELQSIADLIFFRESYIDKLEAYCRQKVTPKVDYDNTSSTMVDFNKKS